MLKKLKFKLISFLATRLGWIIILLLGKSTKITYINRKYLTELKASGKGCIALLWHGRLLLPAFVHRNMGVVAMVSQHSDGEMIAQTVQKLGYRTVRGSSTRGGKEAFHEMIAELKNGAVCIITPDGPQGPRHKLKPGPLYMAQKTGAAILPLAFSSNKCVTLNSWDRFLIFKPFARSVIIYGEPVKVPPDLNNEQLEEFRQALEQKMIELEEDADDYFHK